MTHIDQLVFARFEPLPASQERGAECLESNVSQIVFDVIHGVHQNPGSNPNFAKFNQPVIINNKTYKTCGSDLLWDETEDYFFRLSSAA